MSRFFGTKGLRGRNYSAFQLPDQGIKGTLAGTDRQQGLRGKLVIDQTKHSSKAPTVSGEARPVGKPPRRKSRLVRRAPWLIAAAVVASVPATYLGRQPIASQTNLAAAPAPGLHRATAGQCLLRRHPSEGRGDQRDRLGEAQLNVPQGTLRCHSP